MRKWKGGEAEKEHIHRTIKHTSLPSHLKKQATFPLISFFCCSQQWRVWFETQPPNNATRGSTLQKETATDVVDLTTNQKWREFATSTLNSTRYSQRQLEGGQEAFPLSGWADKCHFQACTYTLRVCLVQSMHMEQLDCPSHQVIPEPRYNLPQSHLPLWLKASAWIQYKHAFLDAHLPLKISKACWLPMCSRCSLDHFEASLTINYIIYM